MRNILIGFFIAFGVLIVFYFSWIDNPRFGLNQFVPQWLAKWADKHENDNIRTAVPLVFLGLVSGFYVCYRKKKWISWILVWLVLVFLVIIAELGQLLLPLRSADFKDVFWGATGAGLGLGFMVIMKTLFIKIK